MGSTLMTLLQNSSERLDSVYIPVASILGVMIIFDAITGVLRALIKNERLCRDKAFKGLLKKMLEIFFFAFGCLLDILGLFIASKVDFLPDNMAMPFGTIVGVYLIITEAISVLSNVQRSDNSIMPKWLPNLFKSAKKSVDDMKKDEK